MSIQSTLKYIFTLTLFSVLAASAPATVFAQSPAADTVVADTIVHTKKKVDSAGRQLCIGINLVQPALNYYTAGQYGYELEADYYLRNEFYAAMEGGWGGSTVNFSDLQYKTTNNFIRLGFNKALLARDNPRDWDMMFMGLRLGIADVDRSAATYTVTDSLWGNVAGSDHGKKFIAFWAEITAGMRVELVKGLFAGWNVRGKFMLDGKSFSDLSPLYIAGYGRGDKNTSFDFNLYISYAIRWKRGYKPVVKGAGLR